MYIYIYIYICIYIQLEYTVSWFPIELNQLQTENYLLPNTEPNSKYYLEKYFENSSNQATSLILFKFFGCNCIQSLYSQNLFYTLAPNIANFLNPYYVLKKLISPPCYFIVNASQRHIAPTSHNHCPISVILSFIPQSSRCSVDKTR